MTLPPIREDKIGDLTLKLVRTYNGIAGAIHGGPGGRPVVLQGTDAEEVWSRLLIEVGKLHPNYFGFDGARAQFLRFFPQGFATSGYGGHERDFKLAAKHKLDTTVPLADAVNGRGFAEAALRVYQTAKLLNKFELAKLGDALRSPSGDAFVRAAASFALGAGEPALREMAAITKPFACANWTVVTYLPFLWRPDEHAFLKPEVTKDFAARVGHPFAQVYKTQINIGVYESLLDLIRKTEAEVAELGPRDGFDIQSFIWVVGAYKDTDAPSPSTSK